jgi:hypothetical protein
MKKVYIFFVFLFIGILKKIKTHKNSHFLMKNDHFSLEKWNFLFFFKNTNKKKDKKYILLLQTFFHFLLF